MEILIPDDSPTDRQFLLEALSKAGCQCVIAENGDEAIAKSKAGQPGLILMDVVLPRHERPSGSVSRFRME